MPAEPPPLTITRVNNQLQLFWDDKDKAIATISDNTTPSILEPQNQQTNKNTSRFELFYFDKNHVALRVWFFWLNKQLGQDKVWIGRHEVPDAERFDLIIRGDGQVIMACTDAHWSELWGEVELNDQLKATLGMTREKLIEEAKKKARESKSKAGQKLLRWLGLEVTKGCHEATRPHNPIQFVRDRVKNRCEKEYINLIRDKGSEAHFPQLHNVVDVKIDDYSGCNQMVSNDVRRVLDV